MTTKNWEKEFDKKFCRKNKMTGKLEEKWFFKETERPKEVKEFISDLLSLREKEIRAEIEKKLVDGTPAFSITFNPPPQKE